MRIKSIIEDHKVSARSVLIEISVGDYLSLARIIYKDNVLQRSKVRRSKTVYSLLKADMRQGCVIPPIVLAYKKPQGTLELNPREAITQDSSNFVLLDGLQRSLTLMEIETETASDAAFQSEFLSRLMRCEIYEGINKIGILYRMLTLNTGQTPMSIRHQIEIMYGDYLSVPVEGITLLREVDSRRARQPNSYNFKEVIEGLNSYLERSESPLDRGDILDNIAGLENLAKENDKRDVFRDFLVAWNKFIIKINSLELRVAIDGDGGDGEASEASAWGGSGVQIFKRAQAITGFGAAIGILRDEDESINFGMLDIEGVFVGASDEDFVLDFNEYMEMINKRAKRIGNAQRLFFRQFFKMLFWRDSGSYLNMHASVKEAFTSANRIGI